MTNKKFISTLIFFLLCAGMSFAQEWQTDYTIAKEMASEEDKPIILVFQGSDWCAPCIKLDRQIWSTDEFKAYAKEHYIMLQADFPKKKQNALSASQTKANAQLAETYNKKGIFPLVVVLDTNGKVKGETSYKKITVAAYIENLNSFAK